MAAYARPRFNWLTGFLSGASGWGLSAGGYNDLVRALDAALHLRVASFTPANDPPGSPANGLVVIVGSVPTGAFVGHAGKLAVWDEDASAWFFITIPDGVAATAADNGHFRVYSSGAFVAPPNIANPVRVVRVAFSLEGTMTASMMLARVPFDTDVTFAASPAGSRADAKVAATGATTVEIWRETTSNVRTQVGSIEWAASGTVAAISFTAETTFLAGDVMEFLGPGTPDTTLADIGFLIIGAGA